MSTEWLQEARDAIDGFVAGLQAGIDSADAKTYNADFAEDVMWGWWVGPKVVARRGPEHSHSPEDVTEQVWFCPL
jgi:hypothetical protein